jgi:hypothetical protein
MAPCLISIPPTPGLEEIRFTTVGLSDHSGLEQKTLEIRILSWWSCETLIEIKVLTDEGEATPIIQEKISTGIAGMF